MGLQLYVYICDTIAGICDHSSTLVPLENLLGMLSVECVPSLFICNIFLKQKHEPWEPHEQAAAAKHSYITTQLGHPV